MLLPLELTQTAECSVEVHIVADLLQHSLKGRVAVDVFHRATGTKTDKTICRYDSSLRQSTLPTHAGGLTNLRRLDWRPDALAAEALPQCHTTRHRVE